MVRVAEDLAAIEALGATPAAAEAFGKVENTGVEGKPAYDHPSTFQLGSIALTEWPRVRRSVAP